MPAFGDKYVKGSAGGGGVHHFNPDLGTMEGCQDFHRWKLLFGTGAK